MNQTTIPDVQGKPDTRNIAITRVGIRDIRMPLHIATPHGPQPTVATAEMTVALPHHHPPPERGGRHQPGRLRRAAW